MYIYFYFTLRLRDLLQCNRVVRLAVALKSEAQGGGCLAAIKAFCGNAKVEI